jgi:hypothetical protein
MENLAELKQALIDNEDPHLEENGRYYQVAQVDYTQSTDQRAYIRIAGSPGLSFIIVPVANIHRKKDLGE